MNDHDWSFYNKRRLRQERLRDTLEWVAAILGAVTLFSFFLV